MAGLDGLLDERDRGSAIRREAEEETGAMLGEVEKIGTDGRWLARVKRT